MNFIKPCKQLHIYLTNIHIKTVFKLGDNSIRVTSLCNSYWLWYMHKVVGWAIMSPQPKGWDILFLVRILSASASASALLRFRALSFETMDGF